jgi:thioredoxin-related protein
MLFPLRTAAMAAGVLALAASAATLRAGPQDPAPKPAPQTEPAAAPEWHADFDEAAKVAKAENKDLLVDFTGSDWCPPCIKLEQDVFSKPEFVAAAKKDFVLVKLDFPKQEEAQKRVPNPERNAELRDKYQVTGYPTVLLLDSSGEVYGSTGYRPGTPAEYVAHLGEVRATGKKLLTQLEAWNKAEEAQKPQAWDELAASFEALEPSSALVGKATPAIRQALTFDADNAQGRKLRALKALFRQVRAEPTDEAAARELDPKNEHGLLELVVQMEMFQVGDEDGARKALEHVDALGAIKDPKVGYLLNGIAAYYAQMLSDMPRAKAYAQKAKDIGGDDPRISQLIESILGS